MEILYLGTVKISEAVSALCRDQLPTEHIDQGRAERNMKIYY